MKSRGAMVQGAVQTHGIVVLDVGIENPDGLPRWWSDWRVESPDLTLLCQRSSFPLDCG